MAQLFRRLFHSKPQKYFLMIYYVIYTLMYTLVDLRYFFTVIIFPNIRCLISNIIFFIVYHIMIFMMKFNFYIKNFNL